MRVALYGHGHMGRHHARLLAPRVRTLVVIDPAQGAYGDGDRSFDAAIVATPTPTHAEVALPLLRAGVPCLIEKPLATSLEDAVALAGFPHLAVGHVERFNPTLAPLRGVSPRFVQADRVGRPRDRGLDVDVVLDLMIHDLDLFMHMCATNSCSSQEIEVRANGIGVTNPGVVDIAHARLETSDGRVGLFTASRLARGETRRLRVFAEGAYWSLDLRERAVTRVRWDGALHEETVPVEPRDALADELDAFLAAARGEAPFTPSGAEGLAALALALRVRDAMAVA